MQILVILSHDLLESRDDDAVLFERVLVDELQIEELRFVVVVVVAAVVAHGGRLFGVLGLQGVAAPRLLEVLAEQLLGLLVHFDEQLLLGYLVAVE